MLYHSTVLEVVVFFLFILLVSSADYYKLLGVRKNASDKEIKKAYR
jgi:preprotein translocase subunit Sec63